MSEPSVCGLKVHDCRCATCRGPLDDGKCVTAMCPRSRENVLAQPVHLVGYASQPSLQYVCDESWDEPAWQSDDTQTMLDMLETEHDGIYLGDTGRLYTFDLTKATCGSCKSKARGT
jgi:hypothetical protein